jgi:UDP-N-acetylmuramoyl-L-alanyl-D-glutamate--2,6-diaminopimelate ligase
MDGTGPGDVVVIAGKGHETRQLVAGDAREFSDREWVGRLAGAAP